VDSLDELLDELASAGLACDVFPATSVTGGSLPPVSLNDRQCWPADRVGSVHFFAPDATIVSLHLSFPQVTVSGQNFQVIVDARYAEAVQKATGGVLPSSDKNLVDTTTQADPFPRPTRAAPATPSPEGLIASPSGSYGVIVRTDFGDAAGWAATMAEVTKRSPEGFRANVVVEQNAGLKDLTTAQVLALVPRAFGSYILIADRTTMAAPEHPLLVLQLGPGAGGSFRAAALSIQRVENNLSTANTSFEEFVHAVDPDGVFRGF
jgi:hypothetical protein